MPHLARRRALAALGVTALVVLAACSAGPQAVKSYLQGTWHCTTTGASSGSDTWYGGASESGSETVATTVDVTKDTWKLTNDARHVTVAGTWSLGAKGLSLGFDDASRSGLASKVPEKLSDTLPMSATVPWTFHESGDDGNHDIAYKLSKNTITIRFTNMDYPEVTTCRRG